MMIGYDGDMDTLLQEIRSTVDKLLVSENDIRPLKYKVELLKPKDDEDKRYYLSLKCIVGIPNEDS